MNLVLSFLAFDHGSSKRLVCFKSFTTPGGVSLRPFCPTRWILRKPSITSITSNYSAIIKWLEDFDTHAKKQKTTCWSGWLPGNILQVWHLLEAWVAAYHFHNGRRFEHCPTRSSAKFLKGRKYYQHFARHNQSISLFREIWFVMGLSNLGGKSCRNRWTNAA